MEMGGFFRRSVCFPFVCLFPFSPLSTDPAGDAQLKGTEQRARASFGLLGQNIEIAQRFEAETLEEILTFATPEKHTSICQRIAKDGAHVGWRIVFTR